MNLTETDLFQYIKRQRVHNFKAFTKTTKGKKKIKQKQEQKYVFMENSVV